MKNNQHTILLIDDDEELCEAISTYLIRHEYQVRLAYAPSAAYASILENPPDLILLDIMLPEEDGFEVCKKLVAETETFGTIPIIMLTARGDVFDRVVGLEMGASDYLPKPFEPRELLARIRSTLRQAALANSGLKKQAGNVESFKPPSTGLFLDQQTQQVWLDGCLLELTSMEHALLTLLYNQPNTIFSRDQIMDHLRGTDASIYSRAIDALVKRLRKKLGDESKKPHYIKTVWGRGYELLNTHLAKPESKHV